MMVEHVLPNLKSTKAFVILFQTSASGQVNFLYAWETAYSQRQPFKVYFKYSKFAYPSFHMY